MNRTFLVLMFTKASTCCESPPMADAMHCTHPSSVQCMPQCLVPGVLLLCLCELKKSTISASAYDCSGTTCTSQSADCDVEYESQDPATKVCIMQGLGWCTANATAKLWVIYNVEHSILIMKQFSVVCTGNTGFAAAVL